MRLPNGYGTVYKLPGKRRKPWIARKTSGWEISSEEKSVRQKYITIGYYPSKQAALQALAAFNETPYDIEMSKKSFSEIYRRWFDEAFDDPKAAQARNYETVYKKYCTRLYDYQIGDIKRQQLQDVLNISGSYSRAERLKSLFNKLYRWCLKYECVKKNCAEELEIPFENDPTPRNAFSPEEIEKLWNAAPQNPNVPIVLMLIYSGVRINELLNLRKEDVNLEEQFFHVRESKTKAGIRMVPIANKVLPFWVEYNKRSTHGYAVCTANGDKLNYDNFKRRYWYPLMDQLGMEHTIHETRHTFISRMVVKNVNQTIIKKIVGHKSIMNLTERVYTHIELQELLDAVNLL